MCVGVVEREEGGSRGWGGQKRKGKWPLLGASSPADPSLLLKQLLKVLFITSNSFTPQEIFFNAVSKFSQKLCVFQMLPLEASFNKRKLCE